MTKVKENEYQKKKGIAISQYKHVKKETIIKKENELMNATKKEKKKDTIIMNGKETGNIPIIYTMMR